MNAHALVARLLETEDIDWTPDPEDPDSSTRAVDALHLTPAETLTHHGFQQMVDRDKWYRRVQVTGGMREDYIIQHSGVHVGRFFAGWQDWTADSGEGNRTVRTHTYYDASEIIRVLDDEARKTTYRMVGGFLQFRRVDEAEDIDWSPDTDDPDASTSPAHALAKRQNFKKLHVVGRRWYRRTYGGIYGTVDIYVDDVLVAKLPSGYGPGDMYQTRAMDWLRDNGYIPEEIARKNHYLRLAAEKMGFTYTHNVYDVKRERDL